MAPSIDKHSELWDDTFETFVFDGRKCGNDFSAFGCAIEAGMTILPVGKIGKLFRWGTRALRGAKDAEKAANTGRGMNELGGVIEQTGTNSAGGRIFTSIGTIMQKDFDGIVNGALMRGDDVHILTGAHGLPNGTMTPHPQFLADDLAQYGEIPGVTIHDLPSMSPAAIRDVLSRPGTIIGGICNSGVCLAPYR